MKKTVLSALALSALVFACKKDKDDDGDGVNIKKEELLGKWEMKTQYRNVVDNNAGKRDTTVMQAGLQGWTFMSDDRVASYLRTAGGMSRDTGVFKIEGSTIIITKKGATKGDTTKITEFSSSQLQAYKKVVTSDTKYSEFWFNYQKQ